MLGSTGDTRGSGSFASHFDEVMEDMWFQHQELIAAGEEQVPASLRWGGRGKGSGVDSTRAGKLGCSPCVPERITRVEEFATKEQALTAVGRQDAGQTSHPG